MKIKIILFAAMFAVSGLTRAQVSKDAFEKSVDYVNCKSVELSLKKSSTTGVTSQFQANCSCDENPDFTKIKSAIPQTETKTIELSAEIDKVKTNEFKPSLKPDEVIKLLTEDIFTNQTKYKKLFDFASKRKDNDAFASMKLELKNFLATQLESQSQASNSQQNAETEQQVKLPSLEERVNVLEQRQAPKVEDKSWFEDHLTIFVIITFIISIILIALKIFQVVSNSSANDSSTVDYASKNYVREKINQASFNSNSNTGTSSIEVRNLKDEIEKLRGEVRQLSSKIESSKIPLEIVQPRNEQQLWQDTKQPEVKTETFFLSTPNADGSFNDSSVSPNYKEGASIYKFTKVGSNRAKFQIDEREASVKLALTYPDKSIDPVCDAVNAFNPKAKRITTVDVGEAELLNDKWIVNKSQKAKIRYES